MCDLNPEESAFVISTLGEISALATQLDEHAASIGQSAYMDHDALAALLVTLRQRADSAATWVADKPHPHVHAH
jgi:hypothetical protein